LALIQYCSLVLKVLLCYFLTTLYLQSVKATLERVQKLNSQEGKILGTSKVGPKYRVTLVKDVQVKLKAKIGDVIVYLEEPNGKIVLKAVSYEQLLKTARR
jgi:ABC-type phosphate/phosphonate transport system substrate-binding protein